VEAFWSLEFELDRGEPVPQPVTLTRATDPDRTQSNAVTMALTMKSSTTAGRTVAGRRMAAPRVGAARLVAPSSFVAPSFVQMAAPAMAARLQRGQVRIGVGSACRGAPAHAMATSKVRTMPSPRLPAGGGQGRQGVRG
jgi:hypothetical protein